MTKFFGGFKYSAMEELSTVAKGRSLGLPGVLTPTRMPNITHLPYLGYSCFKMGWVP